jgi:hypothetical protein
VDQEPLKPSTTTTGIVEHSIGPRAACWSAQHATIPCGNGHLRLPVPTDHSFAGNGHGLWMLSAMTHLPDYLVRISAD